MRGGARQGARWAPAERGGGEGCEGLRGARGELGRGVGACTRPGMARPRARLATHAKPRAGVCWVPVKGSREGCTGGGCVRRAAARTPARLAAHAKSPAQGCAAPRSTAGGRGGAAGGLCGAGSSAPGRTPGRPLMPSSGGPVSLSLHADTDTGRGRRRLFGGGTGRSRCALRAGLSRPRKPPAAGRAGAGRHA